MPWPKGKHRTPETKAKMSAAHKGTHHTPEAREKMSAALKTSPKAIAHRANIQQLHPSMPNCILREMLLPSLLPEFKIIAEETFRCPHPSKGMPHSHRVDAYIPALKLAVEADGNQHRKAFYKRQDLAYTIRKDAHINRCLRKHRGITVIRFTEQELHAYAKNKPLRPNTTRKFIQIAAIGLGISDGGVSRQVTLDHNREQVIAQLARYAEIEKRHFL